MVAQSTVDARGCRENIALHIPLVWLPARGFQPCLGLQGLALWFAAFENEFSHAKDCGPFTQRIATMAERTRPILQRSPDADPLRDPVVARFGRPGLVTIAIAHRPIHGSDPVARFLFGVLAKFPLGPSAQVLEETVNRALRFDVEEDGRPVQTMWFDVRDGRVGAAYIVRNPDKLARLVRPREH